jgi:hypothetical protein
MQAYEAGKPLYFATREHLLRYRLCGTDDHSPYSAHLLFTRGSDHYY